MDKNKVGLNGFVTLTIAPDAGADVVFSESQLKMHRVEVKNGKLDSSATIEGLPERGPVRVMVTADFNSGQLILDGHVMRLGNPDSVTAMTYSCILNDDDDSLEDEDNICPEEALLKTSKLNETTVFGPGEQFLVVGAVMDSAGNTLLEGASASEDRAEGVTSDTLEFGSASIKHKTSRIVGTIPADADAGNYDIEVAVGGASATVSIIVSDVASMISVSCDPEIIATDSGLTDCTATVTDAIGNIPSNLGEAENAMGLPIDDVVRVAVRSTGVDIIGADSTNDVKLDGEGMAMFRVLLREDAREGSITVNVSTTIGDETLRSSTSVMYGDPVPPNVAPMAGDDVADQMVYVGAMVEVQSNFSDPDEDMLSYTATSDMMDVATATVDSAGMVTITGVAMGTATITVTATDPDGMYDMQTIMVTVMTPNMAPMAGDDVADQMVYVGAMVEVQSNFSDPDEDMLSYTATSDMMDVATATVDSAGMVTITGVAMGTATITVTATDPDGMYDMQTIMVTVMMMPPMELGDPVVTGAMSDATGMATIMLTPAPTPTSTGFGHSPLTSVHVLRKGRRRRHFRQHDWPD